MRAWKFASPNLRKQVAQAGADKGAAVVMDPATGDLLAAVSFPLPSMDRTHRIAIPIPTSIARATVSIRPVPRSR